MERTSVPASSKWVANAWRSECGVTGLVMPQRRCALRQACSTASYQFRIKEIVYHPGSAREVLGDENPSNSWAADVSR